MELFMRKVLFIAVIILVITGCVSRPQPLEDKYLVDMTQEEKDKLSSLEDALIAKRQEKVEKQEEYEAVESDGIEEDKKLAELEKQLIDLKDKARYLKAEKNEEGVSENQTLQNEKKAEIDKQKKVVDYFKTRKDYHKSNVDVKDAELAVILSELNYEKSKIAKRNRDKEIEEELAKNPPQENDENKKKSILDKFKKDKGPQSIDVEKYRKYYEQEKDRLFKTEEKNKKAKFDYDEATEQYNKLIS